MASDSFFSSSSSEQRWVDQIGKAFQKELTINIDIPVCIFHVPKTLGALRPEAYAPQQIGLGPYHHLQPELYQMERRKFAAAKRVLNNPDQILNFQPLVIDRLKELEPIIRACYDRYLDLDGHTLAWILAMDGLFLLDLLRSYCNENEETEISIITSTNTHDMSGHLVDSAGRKLAQDIMMLENQIPVIVLKEIRKALQFSFDDDENENEMFLFAVRFLLPFCEAHSPLKLAKQLQFWTDSSRVHLLDYMYHLIVNNQEFQDMIAPFFLRLLEEKSELIDNVTQIVSVADDLGIGGGILKPFKFILTLPWAKISGLFGKKAGEKKKPLVEEITIPSVSNLSKIAGVKFMVTDWGIRSVKFDKEERNFYLPVITLNDDSEVILRNLVAYEASSAMPGATLELAQYVDLMCGIIDTAEDVRLLREKDIIKGDLPDDKIADLFNGISKSTGKSDKKSDLENTIDKINEQFDNSPRVKIRKFFKKYVYGSWKMLTVITTIIVLLLLTLQAFCTVYGCSSHFFGKSSALHLGFADVFSSIL